jgi:hypothetical protein
MKYSKAITCGVAAASIGLLATSPAAQSASIIDLPQPAGNTVQVAAGGDKFVPQFALWPIPNQSNNKTESNVANNRGNSATGQAWLLGFGTGNVVQFATGGNIVNPQFAVGTDNNSKNLTLGNEAQNDGNGSASDSTGQAGRGLLIDGNGNVFQVAFLQGNIIAPQFAIAGNNNGDQTALGNYAQGDGNGSSANSNNGFAFVTGNGNIIQIEILSDNVIAPQVAVFGDNTLVVDSEGNQSYMNGNDAAANVNGSNPLAGIFSVTGNGNVTHIAILSNNVWAPQIALPGKNTSSIFTNVNDAQDGGNGSTTTGDAVPVVNHPVLDSVRSTLDQVTGTTNRPVLDAIEKSLPKNQFGNGNVQQTANNSGAIDNPQIAFNFKPAVSAPVAVNNDPPKVETTPVVESFKATPTVLAGDNDKKSGSTTSTSTTKPGWKPGDGIKKVVAGITKALTPKPKPANADSSTGGDAT